MSVVWTDVTRIRSREEKKNEENRNGTRKPPLMSNVSIHLCASHSRAVHDRLRRS